MRGTPEPQKSALAIEARSVRPLACGRSPARRPSILLWVFLAALCAGCATPVSTSRVGLREVYRDMTVVALNAHKTSYQTAVVLHRYDLSERFEEDPAGVLALLHQRALNEDDRRDLRFALAELCFLYGDHLGESTDPLEQRLAADHFLMSAAYAAIYLFGESREESPSPYDRRFREACDLYNRALGKGLATGEGGQVELRNVVRELPIGRVALSVKADTLPWPLDGFEAFLLADDYAVHGLTVRNRTPGLGVPLIAVPRREPGSPRVLPVPVTVVLRFSGKKTGELARGAASATLELYSAYEETSVQVVGHAVPLETDSTASLAYGLDDPSLWSAGSRRFLGLEKPVAPGLTLFQPYQRGHIPVVFVHGTASSPVWWAEMMNTLHADPVLRMRCQFWFFRYNSSNPIVLSASELRHSLSDMLGKLDPEGKDPALRQMVVIGHSQGGLLTKMTAVSTGDRLWRAISDVSVDELQAKPEVKELVRRYMFLEPLPYVRRVVFISTPHRGSFLAKGWIRNLVRRLVTLPGDVMRTTNELLTIQDKVRLPLDVKIKRFTSLDSMSPSNPVMLALAEIPVAPGVKAHSIIAVKGEGDPTKGNDGVVEYTSAHLEGVESEFIVRSEHSCQGNPHTIEEVRRILLEHLGKVP